MRSGFYTAGVSNLEAKVSASVEFDDGPGLMALNVPSHVHWNIKG